MHACGCAVDQLDTDLTVVEYEQLKEEQRLRITSRDNLVYATLVAVGAVCGAALQAGSRPLLLLLPAVCVILGWTHISNDRKVTQIGRHIRQSGARLSRPVEPFAWESAHQDVAGYRLHKRIQAAVSLLTFCAPGIAAFAMNWPSATNSPPTLALLLVEAIALALLGQQLVSNARSNR